MTEKRSVVRIAFFMVLLLVCFVLDTGSAQASKLKDMYPELVNYVSRYVGASASVISLDRTHLVDDIYEYSCILKVGNGDFDKIGVYRVVKEKSEWVPITADKAVMMVHGDSCSFDSSFLMSTLSDKVPADKSLAIYLARNDIDVWGCDRRWTFVPDDTSDFSFMENWNIALHLQDLKLAVKLARLGRWISGSGFGQIFMIGHSSGAALTYAYANAEASADPQGTLWQRPDLKGIIPMDIVYKFDPTTQEGQDLIEDAQERYFGLSALYEVTFCNDAAQQMKNLADAGATQTLLTILTATHLTYSPLSPPVPFYHYCAGTFDPYPVPTGLQFTDFDYMLDFLYAVPSFQSLGEQIELEAIRCGIDVPYDDHLEEITIPAFYVGAAGGFGEYGEYTLDLIGSTDTSSLLVSRLCGDVNCDGKVGTTSDLQTMIAQWLNNEPRCCNQWAADLNGDGDVDTRDVQAMIAYWLDQDDVNLNCRCMERIEEYGHIDLLFAGPSAETMVWEPIYDWINNH